MPPQELCFSLVYLNVQQFHIFMVIAIAKQLNMIFFIFNILIYDIKKGVNKYCKNLEKMWRFHLGPWLKIMWVFATPFFTLVKIISLIKIYIFFQILIGIYFYLGFNCFHCDDLRRTNIQQNLQISALGPHVRLVSLCFLFHLHTGLFNI